VTRPWSDSITVLTTGVANARRDGFIPEHSRNPVHRRNGAEPTRYLAPDLLQPRATIPANRCRPINNLIAGTQWGVSDKAPVTQSP
jgi:hypothetical protein